MNKLTFSIAILIVITAILSCNKGGTVTIPTDDHHASITADVSDPRNITATCLGCHADAGEEVMQTVHWTWVSDSVTLPNGQTQVPFGKVNSINNFCISVPGNEARCTQCHVGYGWADPSFDFTNPINIDCLVCHDTTGTYKKDMKTAGLPEAGIDILFVARNVGAPSRASCGSCHFNGGGGDGVKHGDMDGTMADCPDDTDVHMGLNDMLCQDCHTSDGHYIKGRLPWMNSRENDDVQCTTCHSGTPHENATLNWHFASVACQTCHIPMYAYDQETRLHWDWSTAGLAEAPDERVWNKKKGSFVMGTDLIPEYYWWNGQMEPYLPGQVMDPAVETNMNPMQGDITDGTAKIWPVKVHRGNQPYDTVNNYLLTPKLFGPDGYWSTWDWNQSFQLGGVASGVTYSGSYGWTETAMYWPLTHMVQTSERALDCADCHTDDSPIDFIALGYAGDPMIHGNRWEQ